MIIIIKFLFFSLKFIVFLLGVEQQNYLQNSLMTRIFHHHHNHGEIMIVIWIIFHIFIFFLCKNLEFCKKFFFLADRFLRYSNLVIVVVCWFIRFFPSFFLFFIFWSCRYVTKKKFFFFFYLSKFVTLFQVPRLLFFCCCWSRVGVYKYKYLV